jgi:hypothetical protein
MDLPPGPPPTPAPAPRPVTPPAPTTNPGTAEGRGQAFVPVEGGNNMQSGEKLLVEAYAAIWVILFALVMLSWRKQHKLEARVAHLEGAIAKARADEAREKAAKKAAASKVKESD